jgi:hypothetical protein
MAKFTPSSDLLKAVRGAMVTKGSSLSAACRELGVKRQNATKALCGEWRGQKADLLVNALAKAAGVSE